MLRISRKFSVLHRQQKSNILFQHKFKKILSNCRRDFDSFSSKKSSFKKPLFYILGITAVGSTGIITYAHYDHKFRLQLDEYFPGSDEFIKFVYQEEKSYGDALKKIISDTSNRIMSSVTEFISFDESSKPSSGISSPPPLVKTSKFAEEQSVIKKEIKSVPLSTDLKKDIPSSQLNSKKESISEESVTYQNFSRPDISQNIKDSSDKNNIESEEFKSFVVENPMKQQRLTDQNFKETEEIKDTNKEKLNKSLTDIHKENESQLRQEFEKELKIHLLRQLEVYQDHLAEVIRLKEVEADKKLQQTVKDKTENLKMIYNKQITKITDHIKELEIILKEKEMAEKQAKRSQLLWTACQSLNLILKSENSVVSCEEQLKPLEKPISNILKAAAEGDELVETVIKSIPKKAVTRGVFSELALRDRFLNVEKVAFRLAGLPEGFISMPKLFLSYLQSFLMIRITNPMLPEELLNEPFDFSSLDNYDILFRARYWIDRGDIVQAVKYMNLLKGAAKSIANEWISEAIIFLETQQAANVLLTHAVYSNAVYFQNAR